MGSVHEYRNSAGLKRYRILYRRPDNTQTSERGFSRKRDAELRLAELELGKARGDYINPTDAKATIEAIGSEWLLARRAVIKPSSFRPIDSAWRTHVRGKWGHRRIGSIRHSEVQTWVSELSKTLSATTVLRAYGVLAAILDIAVRDRRITRNVARDVTLPRKTVRERAYLSHEQVAQLSRESRYPDLVLFLAYTGLRWGEATALRVKHVDVARRRLNVVENAVMVGSYIEVGTPKSHEARSVPYPAFLGAALGEAIRGKRQQDLLFGDGRIHMRLPNSRDGWFAAAVKRSQAAAERARADAEGCGEEELPAEFPRVTPHDLRHTAASLAISAGANVKAVQRMLGHASAAMTLDVYGDLFDDDLDGVANALDRARHSTVVAKLLPDSGQLERQRPRLPSVS